MLKLEDKSLIRLDGRDGRLNRRNKCKVIFIQNYFQAECTFTIGKKRVF